ncbi:MAG TPA: metallophosphoesterase [Lacipirellulaceae bacterium]|nr:metallophosphoesterase [Lacipirellulaceae bacterium]
MADSILSLLDPRVIALAQTRPTVLVSFRTMSLIHVVLLIVGAAGHTILWVALVNRTHALGIHRHWIDGITNFCGLMFIAVPLLAAAAFSGILVPPSAWWANVASKAFWAYVVICAAICVVAIVQRWSWWRHPERRGTLLADRTSRVKRADSDESLAAPGIWSWLSHLPGNEVLTVCLQEKEIAIPRLSQSHMPLRIVQLSDLHMSGRIERGYFERVVEMANAREPDLIAITGDIVEREKCIDWIPATLGRLRASGGVYYVLGNHDLNVNVERLKSVLAEAGLIHVGGVCHEVDIRGAPVLLAGNELPWFKPASQIAARPAPDASDVPLRILLAHSPDQFAWARNNDVDLILAGHLHGGQVCFPLLGAVMSPSLQGVRYAAGVFTAGNTVMHVSRGTGSLTPLRYNCPPEVTALHLRAVSK